MSTSERACGRRTRVRLRLSCVNRLVSAQPPMIGCVVLFPANRGAIEPMQRIISINRVSIAGRAEAPDKRLTPA